MTSKQKKVLYRIIIATVLIVVVSLFCKFWPIPKYIEEHHGNTINVFFDTMKIIVTRILVVCMRNCRFGNG